MLGTIHHLTVPVTLLCHIWTCLKNQTLNSVSAPVLTLVCQTVICLRNHTVLHFLLLIFHATYHLAKLSSFKTFVLNKQSKSSGHCGPSETLFRNTFSPPLCCFLFLATASKALWSSGFILKTVKNSPPPTDELSLFGKNMGFCGWLCLRRPCLRRLWVRLWPRVLA